MLVELKLDPDKVLAWNDNIERCIKEYGDESGIYALWRITDEQQNHFAPFKKTIGIYQTGLNFGHRMKDLCVVDNIEEHYSFSPKTLEDMRNYKNIRNNYGTCDTYKQVLRRYPELKRSKTRKFIVGMMEVRRREQPIEGGWRWHKWGEYIGRKKPVMEYLTDEPDIEKIYCYHIYELIS